MLFVQRRAQVRGSLPGSRLRYVPWSDRTREATTRGSFSMMIPDDRRAACNACHVESPGGPRNLKYEQ